MLVPRSRSVVTFPLAASTPKSDFFPRSSALVKMVRSSFDHTTSSAERSHPSVSVFDCFVFQSITTRRTRSDSNPGRAIARYASFVPSCEKAGCVSVAGFALVTDAGFAEPSAGTTKRSLFVDHASSRPTIFDVKTTCAPSLVIATSPRSPKGFVGASYASPFIRSTGAAAASLHTKRCERRPSSHVSQWRMGSWS